MMFYGFDDIVTFDQHRYNIPIDYIPDAISYLNHDNNANCIPFYEIHGSAELTEDNHIDFYLMSTKDIEKGEELTIQYYMKSVDKNTDMPR